MAHFTPYDWALSTTLVLFGLMAIMHDLAGWRAYVQGKGMGPLPDDGWKARGLKDQCLLGVFFTASFAWAHYVVLMLALLAFGNPLGGWLGIIAITFLLPQFLLLLHFVAWDWVAKWIYVAHLLALSAWTLHAFQSGGAVSVTM